jgi:ACDE family multidrug resistance protein
VGPLTAAHAAGLHAVPAGDGRARARARLLRLGLLLAIGSVFAAPPLKRRFGVVRTLGAMYAALALILALMGLGAGAPALLAVAVIAAGAVLGVVNTVLTEAVMRIAPVERPIASSAYSFVRFAGGAVAPWLAGKLAEWVAPDTPFFVGAAAVVVALGVLIAGRRSFAETEPEVEIAVAPVLVAIDGSPRGIEVTAAAARLAAERGASVQVVHAFGDHEDAIRAVLDRVDAIGAQVVVVGRAGRVSARATVPVVVVPA